MPHRKLPLTGLRVLDLSRVLAGPVCTQILADLGADVVKVERPGIGDDTRQWGPPFLDDNGPSAYYLSANRNKRSLALDLAQPAAADVLTGLVRHADVLIENFLPESLDKLGLRPERLREINPTLVSCSISGFGRTGPLADVPGYDLVIQARAGIMSITGEPDGAPMKIGVAITDVITGLYAAVSILAGLHARQNDADAAHADREQAAWAFDLALADCTLASLVNVAQSALVTGKRPVRYGNAHPNIVPYEAFATADGHLVLAVGNDRQWQRFCHAAHSDELADDSRFATNPLRVENRAALIPLVSAAMSRRTTAEWQELLTAEDVPHAPVLPLDVVLNDPQAQARQMVVDTTDDAGRTFKLLGSPIHWHDEPARRSSAPPALGAHTNEVLAEWLALAPAQIDKLRRSGAIA